MVVHSRVTAQPAAEPCRKGPWGMSPHALPELRRRRCEIQTAAMAPPQKILGSFVQQIGLGKPDGDMITANPAAVMYVPKAETVEGKIAGRA